MNTRLWKRWIGIGIVALLLLLGGTLAAGGGSMASPPSDTGPLSPPNYFTGYVRECPSTTTGIAGVAVRLQRLVRAVWNDVAWATTDSNGYFSLSHVPEFTTESYRIVETDPLGYSSCNAVAGAGGTIVDNNTIEYRDLWQTDVTYDGNIFYDAPPATATPQCWTFQGAVYEGAVGDTSRPLVGVAVAVYGSNNTEGGALIRQVTTGRSGQYSLQVCTNDGPAEYYHIRESNPSGYTSVGARSVSGLVRDPDWIQYVIPLSGKTLTGNNFWDRAPNTATWTTTATKTLTPTPTNTRRPTATYTPTWSVSPPPPTRTFTSTSTATRRPTATLTVTSTGSPPPPTRTFTPTKTATATGTSLPLPDCPELLVNGNFETGSLAPWVASGMVDMGAGRAGGHGVWLGRADNAVAELLQQVTIPAGTNLAQLGFWWSAMAETEQPADSLEVIIQHGGTADHLRVWRAMAPLGIWRQDVLDLTAYAGQQVAVTFMVHTDAAIPAVFLLDDITLRACTSAVTTPTRTPTPTTPCIEWAFAGHVFMATDPEPAPVGDVEVGLFGSMSPDELGDPLAITRSLQDGSYRLDCSSGQWGYPRDYHYLHLAVTDPHYRVVHAESGSGGQPTDQGWLAFTAPDRGIYELNDFHLATRDVIERTFSGRLCSGPLGNCVEPWAHVQVGLFKAAINCDEGLLVAVLNTDALGNFGLTHVTPAEQDAPFYNVVVLDEGIHVDGAESASGGHITSEGWLQFAAPGPGEHGGNIISGHALVGQEIQPVAYQDSYVSAQASDSNYGSAPALFTGYSSGPDSFRNRAYVRFDLSYIPSEAVVSKATLNLYLEAAGGEEKVCMSVHEALAQWYEGPPYTPITWANQPSRLAMPAGTKMVDKALGYKTWDITNLVQGWIDGSIANYGVAVVGPEEGNGWSRRFSSKEGAFAPRLVIHIVTSPHFSTPTPTATPTATPTDPPIPTPISRQIQVLGVEVNQAIQDMDTTEAYLVAGKAGVIRLHLRMADGLGDLSGVTGEVWFNYPYGTKLYPWTSSMTVRSSPNRDSIADSLAFSMPASLATGSPFLFFRIFPPSGVSFSAIEEYQHTTQVTFMQAVPLNVYTVKVSYKMDGTWYDVRSGATSDIRNHLNRIMPVPKANVTEHVFGISYNKDPADFCDGDAFESVNNALAKLRTFTLNVTNSTLFYGMVPDDYGTKCSGSSYVGGMAAGIPAGEASGGVYSGSFSTGDKAAHELGHCLGRYHADSCCGAGGGSYFPYVCTIGPSGGDISGLNISTWAVYPSSTKELMGYCNVGSRWISDYTYDAIFIKLNGSAAPSSANVAIHEAPKSAAPIDSLIVSGILNKTTWEVELDPLFRVSAAPVERPQEGPCNIALRDAQGDLLAEYPFVPRENTSLIEGMDDKVGLFEVVPDDPNVRQVGVICNGQVLATSSASANAPTVTILSPNGGEVWESGPQTITWEAHDEDGDALTSAIQVSRDGGTTWEALGVDLEGTSYTLDTARLAGSDSALIKVIVTDGLLTSEAVSAAPFAIAPKPPVVSIDSPSAGSILLVDRPALFSGYAYDPEEGPLEGLTWTSDRDGALGSGREITAPALSRGWHEITAQAADGDGMVGSATLRVFVGLPLQMPLLMKG